MTLQLLQVVSRDPATMTAQVQNPNEPDPEARLCELVTGVVPVVNDLCWVETGLGSGLIVATHHDVELPKGKMRSTATQTITTLLTPEKFSFNAAGGSTSYDTDFDGTNTMVNRTSSRLVVRWPGKYGYGFHGLVQAGGSVSRRIFDIQLNGTTFLPVRSEMVTNTDWYTNGSDERAFAVGDYIELWITSSQNNVYGTATDELGMCLWMSFRP